MWEETHIGLLDCRIRVIEVERVNWKTDSVPNPHFYVMIQNQLPVGVDINCEDLFITCYHPPEEVYHEIAVQHRGWYTNIVALIVEMEIMLHGPINVNLNYSDLSCCLILTYHQQRPIQSPCPTS